MLKQVEDFKIEENAKITMKNLQEIFAAAGFELSNFQLNELFMKMDAGRSFRLERFTKWIKKNYQFVLRNDQPHSGRKAPDI